MLKQRNILCIANPPWGGEYTSTTVELMKVIGQSNTVLYVESPITFKDVLTLLIKRKKTGLLRKLGLASRLESVVKYTGGGITLFHPPVIIPINFLPGGWLYRRLNLLNGLIVSRSIKRGLRKMGMEDRLIQFVSFNPALGEVSAREINCELLVYHCYDEMASAQWMSKHGPAHEQKLMGMADLTIVTSRWLLESKAALCKQCFLVKNAANTDLFGQAFSTDVSSTKTIGFMGSLDERLDYKLLVFLLRALPDHEFIFIGRVVSDEVKTLTGFPNFKLIPPRKPELLPEVVKKFDLGIIPFAINDFTRGIYPLKINEYLAAGLPVVSSAFSYLEDFENIVTIADDYDEFKTSILNEISTDTIEKKKTRVKFAASNSWPERVAEISAIIENYRSN